MMNRRSFLGLFTAASVAAGLGISPLTSEAQGLYGIRYVEAFDLMRGELMHRIDITRGMNLGVPESVPRGLAYKGATESQIGSIIRRMSEEAPEAAIDAILKSLPLRDFQQVGVSW